uniref:Uncharacterized protein n=1 Tax=Strongyloides papillosus TaxID=174720 RepID=A0A0N5CAR5_STREA
MLTRIFKRQTSSKEEPEKTAFEGTFGSMKRSWLAEQKDAKEFSPEEQAQISYAMSTVNIIFGIVGFACLALGAWLRTDSRFREVLSERYRQAVAEAFWQAPTLYAFSYILIVFGAIEYRQNGPPERTNSRFLKIAPKEAQKPANKEDSRRDMTNRGRGRGRPRRNSIVSPPPTSKENNTKTPQINASWQMSEFKFMNECT